MERDRELNENWYLRYLRQVQTASYLLLGFRVVVVVVVAVVVVINNEKGLIYARFFISVESSCHSSSLAERVRARVRVFQKIRT